MSNQNASNNFTPETYSIPNSKEETAKLGAHLWDEIAKVIALKMQDQLIPVVNFIYDKNYPMDTKIDLLSTEYATRRKRPGHPAPLLLADITFRIADQEIYHLEFQVEPDGNISIRMLEYDFQIALQHDATPPGTDNTTAVTFPHSAVIYPAGGKNLPKYLDCKLQFPDGTSHTYHVPTVDISKYDLKELFAKQLNMFLPFSLLRFSNRLDYLKKLQAVQTSKVHNNYRNYEESLKKDLTAFLKELILGLETEYNQQIISKQYCDEYIRLIHYALERILHGHPTLEKEITKMTEPKIKLIWEIMKEKDDVIAEKDAALSEKDAALSEKDAALSEKDAEIAALKRQIVELQRA